MRLSETAGKASGRPLFSESDSVLFISEVIVSKKFTGSKGMAHDFNQSGKEKIKKL
jgi:hypothetical protein